MNSKQKPVFKSVPTYRKYEDYHDAEQYTRGWNDAMRFIFGIKESDNHCQHVWKEIIDKSGKDAENLCNDCKLADNCTASLKGLTGCKTTKCFRHEWAEKEEEK